MVKGKKRKKSSQQERSFEKRLKKILKSKHYLTVKCASSRPFDLIVIKNQVAYPLEVKGKDTPYPESQQNEQIQLCKKSGNEFVVIQQLKRGKIKVFQPFSFDLRDKLLESELKKDLEKWLE